MYQTATESQQFKDHDHACRRRGAGNQRVALAAATRGAYVSPTRIQHKR
jgi:hypothetical protein